MTHEATTPALSFDTVLRDEKTHTSHARERSEPGVFTQESAGGPGVAPANDRSDEQGAIPEPLPAAELATPMGLALSGGGIRSATFSLGVLQALASRGKLERFDYLSSVSGGGYISGWLSAWIYRDGLPDVIAGLSANSATGKPEPRQVQWLRRYSNYLTPRVGAISLDALTVASTWLRNVLLNLVVLVSFVAAILLLPIAVLFPAGAWLMDHSGTAMTLGLAFGLVSLSFASINLTVKCSPESGRKLWVLSSMGVMTTVIFPGFLASICASCWLFVSDFHGDQWILYSATTLAIFYVVVGIAWLIGTMVSRMCSKQRSGFVKQDALDAITYFFASVPSVALAAGLLCIAWHFLPTPQVRFGEPTANARIIQIVTWGPPSIMLCFGICVSVWIGLVGRTYYEPSREWWSRAGGSFMFASVVCFLWFFLSFYVPRVVADLIHGLPGWLHVVASSGWIGSLFGALGVALKSRDVKTSRGPNWLSVLGGVLTSVFAVGLFVLLACGMHAALDGLSGLAGYPVDAANTYWSRLDAWNTGLPSVLWCALMGCITIAVVFAWRVDINRFSLHNMYKNRLIRCYLGASNPNRKAQPFTGFDRDDDIALTKLFDQKTKIAQRPLHIFNTAMNLVQGSELAWQQRKASSFVLTPAYCGFAMATAQSDQPLVGNLEKLPGFQPTSTYASEDPNREDSGVTLGVAMATSGAAASPNMGANTQPALAVLMTFFNIRLGRWSPNPAGKKPNQSSPYFGLSWLLAELMGFTNERRDFVYLSDGGHFENMGVYELIRRRCLRIVAVDAGADPHRTFEDLGNMLRKCRVDLDTEIKLELTDLFAQDASGRSKAGFITGKIHYPKIGDVEQRQGEILIIKPSLFSPPVESADLFNYASATAFPQESTLDQWFDESQFESYRSLGFTLADAAISAHPTFV